MSDGSTPSNLSRTQLALLWRILSARADWEAMLAAASKEDREAAQKIVAELVPAPASAVVAAPAVAVEGPPPTIEQIREAARLQRVALYAEPAKGGDHVSG